MNSYPSEFLTQLWPVMFIAGLDIAPQTQLSDTEISEDDRILGKQLQADPFALLTKRLRDVLLEKSLKKGAIWAGDSERSSPGFRMILVNKDVRFPPQKANGQDAHSPLSPLTQTSPLYPDGLIAPIWVRKHTELVPAVFVLFLRLYEPAAQPSALPISPLHNQVSNEKEEEVRREEEKRRDSELSAEIYARKRGCSERGVKLTVVLLASRRMLDDPNLDNRLSYIRRQSSLDSRAALFVLSPLSPTELQDFVKSLQSALHEAALEYYLSHSKRVRRKRSKHTGGVVSGPSTMYGPPGNPGAPTSAAFSPRAPAQPLRPQGWIVRYEYKMACFAEFRGEEEVARKHFQTSWETLLDMFGSTAILPPRTKRWAEAKVLADCISVKIIKLYLYRAEHSRAMAHFNAHLTRFADFSRGWRIGEDTWEFWSWIARWYRILAELLDMATSSTLTIPQYLPSYPIAPSTPPASYSQLPQHLPAEPTRSIGLNPSSILQHPGFYYYAAARCTQRRLEQFITADQDFGQQNPGAVPTNLANEKKVDHRVIILELYTKAYEVCKKFSYSQGQNRLTLHIACRIAQIYHDNGKPDMAVKFFERIAKAYGKERWDPLLKPVLSTWYACTRQTGDVETTVKLLIEMMCSGAPEDFDEGQLEEDLAAILRSTSPSTTPFKLEFSDSRTLFTSSIVFWQPEIGVSQAAPFQLHLKAPTSVSLTILPCVSLRIEFSDHRSVIVRHCLPPETTEARLLQFVDLGLIPSGGQDEREVQADLRWPTGGTLVMGGSVASDIPTTLGISKVTMNILEGHWDMELIFDLSSSRDLRSSHANWLGSLDPPIYLPIRTDDPSVVTVRHKPHQISVSLTHPAPAYLDEEYPISVSVTNIDDHDLSVTVDVLLQPAEDDTVNHISFGLERSTGLIKGVTYGLLAPGESAVKTLLLHSTRAPGDRIIDVSIQCEHPGPGLNVSSDIGSPVSPRPSANISESLHTLIIPTIPALEIENLASYRRSRQAPMLATDLKSYDPSAFDEQAEAIIRTSFTSQGPWDISIETFAFLPAKECESVKLLNCSLDGEEDDFPLYCNVGDRYSAVSRFVILAHDDVDHPEDLPSPGEYQVTWSRVEASGLRDALAVTRIPLPSLRVPKDNLDALLELPAAGTLHTSLTVTLKIRNRHTWRTADVHLQLEPSDQFVLSGLRSGSLPVLLAGSEEHLAFNLIPISCGTVRLPTFKLFDRRRENEERRSEEGGGVEKILPVVDGRLEERNEKGEEIRLMVYLRGEGGTGRLRRVDAEGLSMFITPS